MPNPLFRASLWQEALAARCLNAGGLVVHATESVFGIAARITYRDTALRLARLKQRSRNGGRQHKPFLVIAADLQQVRGLVDLNTPIIKEIEESWPGPNTWILPLREEIPRWVGGSDGRLAIRITGHPQARQIIELTGPLFSTSANLDGSRL